MATELVIVHHCDICLADGTTREPAVFDVTIASAGAESRVVEACAAHAKPLRDAWALASKYGAAPDAGQPTTHAKVNGAAAGYPCPVCGKTFAARGNARSHARSVHGLSAERVGALMPPEHGPAWQPSECPYCGTVAGGKVGLIAHVRSTHPEQYSAFRLTDAGRANSSNSSAPEASGRST